MSIFNWLEKPPKKRLALDVPEDAFERILEIQEDLGLTTVTETVKVAMALLDQMRVENRKRVLKLLED